MSIKFNSAYWAKTTLDFSRVTSGTLSRGTYTSGDTVVTSVLGDLQPTTKDLTYAEFGFVIDAQYKFYADGSSVKVGDTTIIDGVTYRAEQVIQWDDYQIVLLKAVENG